jgi:RimJ/RimL family protein N-acetyltransferase
VSGRERATEAAIASVRFGFNDLGLRRILGLVMPENIGSVRVLEKAGLRYAESVAFWGNQFSKYVVAA